MWVRFAFFALRQTDHDDASWRTSASTVRAAFAVLRCIAFVLPCRAKIVFTAWSITEFFNGLTRLYTTYAPCTCNNDSHGLRPRSRLYGRRYGSRIAHGAGRAPPRTGVVAVPRCAWSMHRPFVCLFPRTRPSERSRPRPTAYANNRTMRPCRTAESTQYCVYW